uniref:UspA domain-containing protein n=1 Tax=Populus davidiana TaxID=266767 RepID=A0A6M2F4X2_9ROSI
MATLEKKVMVVGIDDSEHSTYALEWTLDHFFTPSLGSNSLFKLVVVYAKPSASSAVGFAGPGAAEVLPFVESDLKKIAARVIEKAKGTCTSKSVSDVVFELVEGDARNVLCEAVDKHNASILVVGSHGYGAIKRAVLGSVSDYCAHHAHCTVMIVKRPKIKQ